MKYSLVPVLKHLVLEHLWHIDGCTTYLVMSIQLCMYNYTIRNLVSKINDSTEA